MVKRKGFTFNSNVNAKKGIRTRFKCFICKRIYKQSHTKDIHEKKCKLGKDFKRK